MKVKKIFFMIAAGLIFSISGWAQTFEGNVVVVDSATQVMSIQQMNPETRQTETVNISIPEAVDFEGGNSLVDFQPGDEVRVHARKNEITGLWNARKIVKR